MSNNKELSITESSDFHCLLELMLPLFGLEEYSWLPELFAIVGHERLLTLAKYAGGATIRIPTLEQLTTAIEALEWYYRVHIERSKYRKSIPEEYRDLVEKIKEVFDAANN